MVLLKYVMLTDQKDGAKYKIVIFTYPMLGCGAENSGLHVFDFLANSILKEVLSAIQKGKPGAFSPGRPTEFLKNYKSSLAFLAYLEGSSCISLPCFFSP